MALVFSPVMFNVEHSMWRIVLSLVLMTAAPMPARSQDWEGVGSGMDGSVYCLAVYKNELYAGGRFTEAGSFPTVNIARWNGEAWSPVGSGTNGAVHALFVQDDQLYVGGDFTSCGGTACAYVARWDGTAWTPAGDGLNGPVYAIAEYQRMLYIGGAFTKVGPKAANRTAAWNGTGWQDVTGGLNDTVFALTVTPFDALFADLYAGGTFTPPDPPRVAWLHPAYQAWRVPEWGAFNGPVFALTYYAGGVVAGGAFAANTSGSAANFLAQRGNEFYGGADGEVYALLSNGSDLYVGGSFDTVGRAPQVRSPGVAKWNGNSWEVLGSGTNGSVRAIAFYQGALHVGGDFDSAGGVKANHLARWGGTTDIGKTRQAGHGTVTGLWNYPNPFNATTMIRYSVGGTEAGGAAEEVRLTVHDMLGREIVTLVNERKPPGIYQATFKGSGVTSGVYVCRLTTGTATRVRRMILVR